MAPLVRLGTQTTGKRDRIDGRAAFEQGHRLGRPAIVGQGAKLRVGVLLAGRGGEAATAIARQVVAVVGDDTTIGRGAVAARVLGDDAPAHVDRATIVVREAASTLGGDRVAGDGAGADRQHTIVVDATTVIDARVSSDGAGADRHRAIILEAAADASGVAGDGAVRDHQRAVIEEA
ncbi:MAG TPA: hypothetical protein DHW02_15875, partial [Ktedonobacter sp.]|nr:hypothetical protein [Ktedonobacter sp.]